MSLYKQAVLPHKGPSDYNWIFLNMGNEVSLVNEGTPIENDLNITWKQVKPCCSFPAREGQSYCTIGNKLYIYGGVIQCKDEVETINEIICFDCDNEKWTQCEAKGKPPVPSSGSTMSSVGNKLYVFGGLNQETGWSNNLHVYDTETSTWSTLEGVGNAPSPRDKLASVAVGKCIYYFGGFGPKVVKEGEEEVEEEPGSEEEEISSDEEDLELQQKGVEFKWFDDFYIFDTETNTWSQPMHMNLTIPSARAAMTMCAYERDIFIFGGRDCEKRRNDVHVYNIDTRKWRKLDGLLGRLPGCRSYHSATIVGNRMVVMGGRNDSEGHFGDIHVLDIGTGQWLQPSVNGEIPCARGQHSVGVCGDYLVLHGGSAQFDATSMQCKEYLVDTYIAKTESVVKGRSITPESKEKDPA